MRKTSFSWHIPLHQAPEIVWMGIQKTQEHHTGNSWLLHLHTHLSSLQIQDKSLSVPPNCVSIIPPRVQFAWHTDGLEGSALCVSFYLAEGPAKTLDIWAIQDLGARFCTYYQSMHEAVQFYTADPHWASIRLWDLLHDLAARSAVSNSKQEMHSLVKEVVAWIELHLVDHPRVAEIARNFGKSHNHLNTLFKADLGCTVSQYMRKQILQQATLLLQHTDMPIKNIAATLGYQDLHQFNKFIRKYAGRSPRELRDTLNP